MIYKTIRKIKWILEKDSPFVYIFFWVQGKIWRYLELRSICHERSENKEITTSKKWNKIHVSAFLQASKISHNVTTNIPWLWHSGLESSPRKRKVGCSNPRRDRSKSEKQVVTAPLLNAQQTVRVSRVLGDDHYKRMSL